MRLGTIAVVSIILHSPTWQRAIPPAALSALAVLSIAAGIDQGGWLLPAGVAAAVVGIMGAVRGWLLRIEIHPQELTLVNWTSHGAVAVGEGSPVRPRQRRTVDTAERWRAGTRIGVPARSPGTRVRAPTGPNGGGAT
jgi:hypothetical protein